MSNLSDVQPELLSVRDLARLLNVSQRTVWTLRNRGELPSPLKLGAGIRWRRATVPAWLAGLEARQTLRVIPTESKA